MSALLEVAVDSFQYVDLESETGKKFLRRVVREQAKARGWEGWTISARASDGWRLTFFRRTEGEAIGDRETSITVRTSFVVRTHGKTGEVKSFGDAKPVMLCAMTGLHLGSSTVGIAAEWLAKGARFTCESSAGSTSSSEHGIGFYRLSVDLPGHQYATVTLGGETLTVNGRSVVSGAVDLR